MEEKLSEINAALAAADAHEASLEEITGLKQAVAAAEEKVAEHWDRVLRKEAEMQNLRRRTEQSIQEARRYALDQFLQDLIPVVDSLDQGLSTVTPQTDLAQFMEGVSLTWKLLLDTLDHAQVRLLNPQGEMFNPAMHEAIAVQPATEGVSAGQILAVVQKGVMLHDRLVRPARVVIASESDT